MTNDDAIYFGHDPEEIRRHVENPYGRQDIGVAVAGFFNRLRFGASAGVGPEYVEALEAEVRRLRAEVRRLAFQAGNDNA